MTANTGMVKSNGMMVVALATQVCSTRVRSKEEGALNGLMAAITRENS